MLRQRMQRAVESNLCKTQYGFRPQKSTSHAIYIIRRIQDYAEMKGAKLSMAMLDWEKHLTKYSATSSFWRLTDCDSASTIVM